MSSRSVPGASRWNGDRSQDDAAPSRRRMTAAVKQTSETDEHEGSNEPRPVSVLERSTLTLSNNALPPQAALVSTLSRFKTLRKLELCNMQSSEPDWPEGLDTLSWLASAAMIESDKRKGKRNREAAEEEKVKEDHFGKHLTQLNVSGNDLGSAGEAAFDGIEAFQSLIVLNCTRCLLSSIPVNVLSLASLNALVLSHNSIAELPPVLPNLPQLTTLILSHNSLRSLPRSLPASVPALKKLGLSFNKIAFPPSDMESLRVAEEGSADWEVLVPDFTSCASLREVRLNGNVGIRILPSHLATWGKGLGNASPGLDILDMADCSLLDWSSIAPLMSATSNASEIATQKGRKGLSNLTLKGNELAELDDYRKKILDAIPTLRVLDSQRVLKKREDEEVPVETAVRNAYANSEARGRPEKENARQDADAVKSKRPEKKQQQRNAKSVDHAKPTRSEDRDAPKHKRGGRGSKKRKHEADDEGRKEVTANELADTHETVDVARVRGHAGPPRSEVVIEDAPFGEPTLGVQEDEGAEEESRSRKRARRGKKAEEWGLADEALDDSKTKEIADGLEKPKSGKKAKVQKDESDARTRKGDTSAKSKGSKKAATDTEKPAWDAGSAPIAIKPAPATAVQPAPAPPVAPVPEGRGDSGLTAIIEIDARGKQGRKGKGKGAKDEPNVEAKPFLPAGVTVTDTVGGGSEDVWGSGGASAWG